VAGASNGTNRVWYLLVCAVVALLIALAGSYFAVVSQNAGAMSDQPLTLYGPDTP
jgi:hypothetical protein